ncbi:hypothetical protein ACFQL7_01880 [Halocatena marina]|uniref:Sulfatase N-terminal domain-containing protein n=1 Tax=Halocatena marina TaxID=2934937 RepID=A0ABD5YIL0_9EURY
MFDREWDNLLILDACRYDLFEEHHEFPGTLSKVRSAGSHSREFITRNFLGTTHHDTVYITSNPFASLLDGDTFHAVINLFDDEWDEDVHTVRPESVVAATIEAHEAYPEKRIIAHFMQPHYPFLGERGSQFESGGVSGDVVGNGKNTNTAPSIWHLLDIGRSPVDSQTAREGYIENFALVQEHVQGLLGELDGKSVITSDHGNLLGERLWPTPIRKFGHPEGVRKPGLIEVPWHEIPFDQRRTTTADTPEESEAVSDSVVEQRLEHLGYV